VVETRTGGEGGREGRRVIRHFTDVFVFSTYFLTELVAVEQQPEPGQG
jgi:hypothetical protein